MDKHELLRKISAFHLVSRDLAEDLLAGDFASVFRGQGMDFDGVRHYEMGDDVRSIDWNVTARFGEPYVKLYREERELSLCIVLDGSLSMRSGSGPLDRYGQGVMAAALLAFSAELSGQRVGALLFDRDIVRVWNPRRGRAYIMSILNSVLDALPRARGSGLGAALAGTARILARRRFRRGAPRCLVAVISDFMALNWEQALADLAARHDVIALKISDPMDQDPPRTGLLSLMDDETGLEIYVRPGSGYFRESWRDWQGDRSRRWLSVCRRAGVSPLTLSTADDAPSELVRYFRARLRQRDKRGFFPEKSP